MYMDRQQKWNKPEVKELGDAFDLIQGTIDSPPKETATPTDGLFTDSQSTF